MHLVLVFQYNLTVNITNFSNWGVKHLMEYRFKFGEELCNLSTTPTRECCYPLHGHLLMLPQSPKFSRILNNKTYKPLVLHNMFKFNTVIALVG